MKRFLICSVFICACSESAPPQSQLEDTAAVPVRDGLLDQAVTEKMSAAVIFTREFAGPMEIYEKAPIVLQFHPQYPAGTLLIDITADDGLVVEGDIAPRLEFNGYEQLESNLILSANQAGLYRLNLLAEIRTPDGTSEFRAFQEIIEVVDANTELGDETEGANLLPASEEIIDWATPSP